MDLRKKNNNNVTLALVDGFHNELDMYSCRCSSHYILKYYLSTLKDCCYSFLLFS